MKAFTAIITTGKTIGSLTFKGVKGVGLGIGKGAKGVAFGTKVAAVVTAGAIADQYRANKPVVEAPTVKFTAVLVTEFPFDVMA